MVCVNACTGGAQSFVSQEYACSSELKWGLFAAAVIGAAAAGAATYVGRLPKNIGVGLTLGGAVGAALAGFWPTKSASQTTPSVDLKKLVGDFDAEQGALVERLEWREIKDLRSWKKGEMVELLKLCPNLKQIDVSGYWKTRDHLEVMKQLAVQPLLEEIRCGEAEENTFLTPDEVDGWKKAVERLSKGKEVPEEAKAYLSRLTHFSGDWSDWMRDEPERVVKIISDMPRLRAFHAGDCPDEPKVWEALQGCAQLEEMVFPKANERVMNEFINLPAELQRYLECLPQLRFKHWKDHVNDDQWPELVRRMPHLKRVDLQEMPKALWTADLIAALPKALESFKGPKEVWASIDWKRRLSDLELALVRLSKGLPGAKVGEDAAGQLLELGELVYPDAWSVFCDCTRSGEVESQKFKLAQAHLTNFTIWKSDFQYQDEVGAGLMGASRLEKLQVYHADIETLPPFRGMWEALQVRELELSKATGLKAEAMELLVNELQPSVLKFHRCGAPAWSQDESIWALLEQHYNICFQDADGCFADDDHATTWTWAYLKEDPTRLSQEVESGVAVVFRRKEG